MNKPSLKTEIESTLKLCECGNKPRFISQQIEKDLVSWIVCATEKHEIGCFEPNIIKNYDLNNPEHCKKRVEIAKMLAEHWNSGNVEKTEA